MKKANKWILIFWHDSIGKAFKRLDNIHRIVIPAHSIQKPLYVHGSIYDTKKASGALEVV